MAVRATWPANQIVDFGANSRVFRDAGWQCWLHKIISRDISGYLRLLPAAPDALIHIMPISSVIRFRGLRLLVGRCSCPQVKDTQSVGDCVFG